MTRWAALPRSINAGKPLAMADFRRFLEDQGLTEVATILASGNAVFTSDETAAALEKRLATAARADLALDTDWFVRSHAELAAILADNPFPEATAARPAQVQVLFHHQPVDIAALATVHSGSERLHAKGRELYVDYPDGIGRSKLPQAMARAKMPPSTARNWNTLVKLVAELG